MFPAASDPGVEPELHLLLVEDDEGDALIVTEELADAAAHAQVTRVRTIAEAESALPGSFTCVLLDLRLPDATGLSGLERLRGRAPQTPILVLTGHGDERQGAKAVAAGAQDYLVKGIVDGALLARAIRYAVERQQAERSQVALREAELHAAENRRLERGLLPTPLVRDPQLVVQSGYRPGRLRALLGGDFFDVVEADDGTVHAVIGDVSGHSADEAALGVHLRIAWRTLTLAGMEPDKVLHTLDRLLVHERHTDDHFATVATLHLAPDRRSVDLRLAGHPPPILLHAADGPRTLEASVRPPIGLDLGDAWPATRIDLRGDWALLLYTDGLIEGRIGAGHARLGTQALARLVAEQAGTAAWRSGETGLVERLITAVEALNGGPMSDDLAVLLLAAGG